MTCIVCDILQIEASQSDRQLDGHGEAVAIWPQSTYEGEPDQPSVFSQSQDEGVTWAKPKIIAGSATAGR